MRGALLEYAEEPGLWIPLAPPSEVIEADGYAIVTSLYSASVERVRLEPGQVERAVARDARDGRRARLALRDLVARRADASRPGWPSGCSSSASRPTRTRPR